MDEISKSLPAFRCSSSFEEVLLRGLCPKRPGRAPIPAPQALQSSDRAAQKEQVRNHEPEALLKGEWGREYKVASFFSIPL